MSSLMIRSADFPPPQQWSEPRETEVSAILHATAKSPRILKQEGYITTTDRDQRVKFTRAGEQAGEFASRITAYADQAAPGCAVRGQRLRSARARRHGVALFHPGASSAGAKQKKKQNVGGEVLPTLVN